MHIPHLLSSLKDQFVTISREKPTSRNWYLFELNKCIYIEREMLKIDKKFTSFEINPMNYA